MLNQAMIYMYQITYGGIVEKEDQIKAIRKTREWRK